MSPAPQTKRGRTTTVSKPSPLRRDHGLLGPRLGARVERLRVGAQRRGLVDLDERARRRAATASVPTCTKRLTPAAAAASSTFSRPLHVVALELLRGPQSPSVAAAWKATSQPVGAGASAARSPSRRDRLGAERRRPAAGARSARARAPRVPRLRSRWIRRPPTKPEPPVTSAFTRRSLPRLDVRPGVHAMAWTPGRSWWGGVE